MTTFEKLIAPLHTFLVSKGKEFDQESNSKALFFKDFILKMVYAVVFQLDSLRSLLADLQSNPQAQALGFSPTPYSTFRDAFSRFRLAYFKSAYLYVLKSQEWLSVKCLDELGIIHLVDGSLFPSLCSMDWATYKKKRKAIRLHLSWELNRQIPVEFLAQAANSSERNFLLSILQKGVTYIADRGYFSFDLAESIQNAGAFFILRIKCNLQYSLLENLPISTKHAKIPTCFSELSDQRIRFDNDESGLEYRLICFKVLQSTFRICTNRWDLSTLQVIMLYAYRWQIELLFKFIKRTLNGIHLFNHSENGVNIQFYVLMMVVLLEIRLKQLCLKKQAQIVQKQNNIEEFNTYSGKQPERWIKSISQFFYHYWKITKQWLRHLKNLCSQEFEDKVIKILATT